MFWYNCLYCAISWDYARLIYLLLNSLNKPKEIFNKTKVEGNHVDIVSVGHVINMKNGQLLYTPQNDDTEYISMTQKDY